jgi:hypothetical protein
VIGFTPSQSLFQSQEPVSAEQLEINNKAITIAEVISFMEETKNVTARIEFFNTFGSKQSFLHYGCEASTLDAHCWFYGC